MTYGVVQRRLMLRVYGGYVRVDSGDGLTSAITVEVWYSMPGGPLESVVPAARPDAWMLTVCTNSVQVFRPAVNVGGVWYDITGPALSSSTMYHMAMTYDGTTLAGYLDGALVGTRTVGGPLSTASGPVYLAAATPTSGIVNYPNIAVIGEARIWRVALSADRIARDRYGRLRGDEADLVAYWPINEAEGTTVYDRSPSGKHGVVVGTGIVHAWTSFRGLTSDTLRVAISSELFGPLDSPRPGRVDVVLDNRDGRYSRAALGDEILVQATYAGSTRRIARSVIEQWALSPAWSRQTAHIVAADGLRDLQVRRVSPPMMVSTNIRSAFLGVLSAASLSGATVAVDSMAEVVPYAWFRDEPALAAIQELMRYGGAVLYSRPQSHVDLQPSQIVVRDRYWSVLSAAVFTLSRYWTWSISYDTRMLLNRMRIEARPRQVAGSAQVVATYVGSPPTIPASGYLGVELAYVDPITGERLTPATSVSVVRSADWLLNTSPDGTGLDRTGTASARVTAGGVSVVVTLFNGSGDQVALVKLQARGYPLHRRSEISVDAVDDYSRSLYGRYEQTLANDFIGDALYAQDYAQYMLSARAHPTPILEASVKNALPEILDISFDRHLVSVVHSLSRVNSVFEVVAIDHDINAERGWEHTVEIRAVLSTGNPWLVYGDATRGVLNGTRRAAW
ncbi:MAG: LamG domain-containing protein [Armatimonadota bacterium]|nr:LamG domain-containing protein [Armatimonadota bacterium]